MAVIRYRRTHFTAPEKISEAAFYHYKRELQKDPDTPLASEAQRFTIYFRRRLINLSWMTPLCLLLIATFLLLFPDPVTEPDPKRITLFVVALIIGVMASGLLLLLLLEGPSYATYLKERAAYFNRMKVDIIQSSDYTRFCDCFYSPGRKPLSLPVTKPRHSLDLALTNGFHFLDKYWWIFFLLAATIFFARKLFA
ncbi:hypothetical protein Q4E93_21385 [Flavitalea sp. BT771]|uniref:hypothetical protein n=1 Tax=Flavitalea sp. BT771 TaxID=3063329 RepID=UPI0026E2F4CB|nr:hypothetical protein [Flavitalea sp. BT771]MDO6433177.1 hypothetical protein [Flavitalea sp. BT771]MDV6221547.1 hypothetical protein [Flavitalea sp. BT771]